MNEQELMELESVKDALRRQVKAQERMADALEAIALAVGGSFNPETISYAMDRERSPLQPLVRSVAKDWRE